MRRGPLDFFRLVRLEVECNVLRLSDSVYPGVKDGSVLDQLLAFEHTYLGQLALFVDSSFVFFRLLDVLCHVQVVRENFS